MPKWLAFSLAFAQIQYQHFVNSFRWIVQWFEESSSHFRTILKIRTDSNETGKMTELQWNHFGYSSVFADLQLISFSTRRSSTIVSLIGEYAPWVCVDSFIHVPMVRRLLTFWHYCLCFTTDSMDISSIIWIYDTGSLPIHAEIKAHKK